MSSDEQFNLDEEIQKLPLAKVMLAFKRALRKSEIDYVEGADDGIEISEEADVHTEEFLDVFGEELKRVYFDNLFQDLQADGLIEPSGVDPETGEINYTITEHGKETLDRDYY